MTKLDMHARICNEMTALYERKNHDYGDSFGKSFAEYGMAMPCIRLEDKLNRLKALTRSGNQQVSDESIDDTLMDLANYAVMTLVERRMAKNENHRCTNCKFCSLPTNVEPCATCDVLNDKWEAEENDPS